MSYSRHLFLYAAAAAAVIAMYATGADAMSIGCEKVWAGPSSDNSLKDCLLDSDRLSNHWPYYIYPLIATLVFLVLLIGVPVLFLCRCCCACCCTSCCREPENPKASRCCLWAWIGIALIWAACVLILIIVGADQIMRSFDNTISDLDSPLNYIMDNKDQIYNLLIDWSQEPPKEPDVDLSAFDDVDRQFHEKIDSFKDDYQKYFDIVSIVSYCVGSICVVLMLLIVPCALCRCAGCLPMVYSVVLWIFGLIFAAIAVVVLLLMYFIGAFCGEINLQYAREPGILQYKVTPWCDEQFNFESARTEISQEVVTASQSACSALLEFCDTNEDYSSAAGNTDLIFVCGNGLTDANTCTSLDKVADIVKNTYVKPILNNALCTDTTGWEYQEKCTLVTCAERCQNLNNPALQAKDWSMDVVRATNYAINASTALSLVTPMMSCDFILDTVLQALESQNADGSSGSTNCSNLRTATVMLGTGFFVGSLMFLLGIYIVFRGSFIWKADEREPAADTPETKSA